ncbi:HK97-gp10 family putative phage morphogenesis protein [Symbiobacterium terraclitae]|uniref:HK97-gp10 family putative phage morphogenesis protein n=1 Tax=Symbiobacterium terraclitae TaxID=557451 RepID=UPI0035B527A4
MAGKSAMWIQVEGLDEAVRRVRSLTSSLEAKEVEQVLVKGMRVVRDEAKQRVPVRTGLLKSAIKAKIGKRRGKMVAGAFSAVDFKRAPHAYLVEYGTRHSRAKPYFRPAWDTKQAEVKKQIEDGLRELLKKGLR